MNKDIQQEDKSTRCSKCIYSRYVRTEGGDKDYTCHRYPPTEGKFPSVPFYEWCGEFVNKLRPPVFGEFPPKVVIPTPDKDVMQKRESKSIRDFFSL